MLVRSAARGLARLLDEVEAVADEIVIGVDESSVDDTFDLVRGRADVVFRFEHVGPPVRARLLVLEQARGEWVLSLDEDEGLDAAFGPLLPELLSHPLYTHYWLPRKWIVDRDPPTYMHAAPWFPDWQLRLFRNDLRRVWHPGIVHSGYRVMGPGCREDRTAILHYEPVTLDAAAREAKVEYYRRHGSEGRSDAAYQSMSSGDRRVLAPGPAAPAAPGGARAGRVVPGVVRVPAKPDAPSWGAALEVSMTPRVEAGGQVLAELQVRNTGRLAWMPGGAWPQLHVSFHVLTPAGEIVRFEGDRFPLPRVVEPGESARVLLDVQAPRDPGDYLIEWDLVSEGERWFADCGGTTARAPLTVTAATEPRG
jgi:hypothetical protein